MKERGHTPIMKDDELDMFVMDIAYHNGPGCSTCGWSTCWHCNRDPNEAVPETCTPL